MGKHGLPLTRSKYPTVVIPGHPLAWPEGRVRVHRAALYEKIGPGTHPCHWCGIDVTWNGKPALVADHLDRDTWNNSPNNLVPACRPCNSTRTFADATHCSKGHEWTPENTYWRKNPGRNDTRMCRACARVREAAARRVR